MSVKNFLIGTAVAALALAGSAAQASVTVHTGAFLASPTNVNDFETINEGFPSNTVYTKDGVNVEYVGSASIWATYAYVDTKGWYANGGGYGYTRITLNGGDDFNGIEFLAGHGYGGSIGTIQYELLLDGSLVDTGHIDNVYGQYGYLSAYGFDGATFDEVRLQMRMGETTFDANGYEAIALDNIKIAAGASTGAVPEPASWAMMIGGFAIAGAAMRRRAAAVSFA